MRRAAGAVGTRVAATRRVGCIAREVELPVDPDFGRYRCIAWQRGGAGPAVGYKGAVSRGSEASRKSLLEAATPRMLLLMALVLVSLPLPFEPVAIAEMFFWSDD